MFGSQEKREWFEYLKELKQTDYIAWAGITQSDGNY